MRTQRAFITAVGWALAFLPPAWAQATDVAEELWIRSAARALAAHGVAPAEEAPATSAWVREVALLEAYSRVGQMPPLALVEAATGDRLEVAAAKLRALPASCAGFEDRLRAGLRSPFGALRSAALARVVAWTLDSDAGVSSLQGFLVGELESGALGPGLAFDLFELALRTSGGRDLGALFALPLAAEHLAANGRAGWEPILGFAEDIVGTPLVGHELTQLSPAAEAQKPVGLGAWAALSLVGRVRDGVRASVPVPVDGIAMLTQVIAGQGPSSRLDEDELDEMVEVLIDAVVLERRNGGDEWALELGEALAALAQQSRTKDASMGEARCARAAARLLPFRRQLELALVYSDSVAFEMWSALDRLDQWPKDAGSLAALGPWVRHPSLDVRDAAVRAIGQRFAYSQRFDLQPLLRAALGDEDATLRSLSFAWLAKAQGPELAAAEAEAGLDPCAQVLRAAWDAEGHGTESPVLTERQARWLAQWPRDVRADVFREPLLGLLALVGTSVPTPGRGHVELLGGFRGDAEVYARVALLLERSLVALHAADRYEGRLVYDSAAARAVRILHHLDAPAAQPVIHQSLLRSMGLMHGAEAPQGARPQLPKTAAALLGATEAGRQCLVGLLGSEVPRRVRFEAALRLTIPGATGGDYRDSARVLMEDFGGVDGTLRLRALQALGLGQVRLDGEVDAFLLRLTGVGGDSAERASAIDALGRRGNLAALAEVLGAGVEVVGADAGTIDAASYAARALRHSMGEGAAAAAAEFGLAELERVAATGRELQTLSTVRGALLEALCTLVAADHGSGESALAPSLRTRILGEVLRVPVQSARGTTPTGFDRARRIEAQFLWASELAALKALAGRPELFREAVGGAGRWGELDGRLLLALAQVSDEAGEAGLAAELSLGAVVALQGEGEAHDHERRLGEARWLLASKALEEGDEAAAVWALRGVLEAYRSGRLGKAVMRAMLPSIERPVPLAHERFWAATARQTASEAALERSRLWGRL